MPLMPNAANATPLDASSNRSREAWLNNFADGRLQHADDVNRTLTLMRIDLDEGPGKKTTPLATWTIFAVHGNSIGVKTGVARAAARMPQIR